MSLPEDPPVSYAAIIRDGLLERMRMLDVFSGVVRFAKTKARPVQRGKLPFLGLYFVDERVGPDGDANATAPHFFHTVRLGVSFMVMHDDPDAAEDQLDRAHMAIIQSFRRQDWYHFNTQWGVVKIEAIQGYNRRHVFGDVALNNETPYLEMQMELQLTYRTILPPIVTDDLKKVHVTTRYPDANVDGNTRQEIVSEYDLLSE